MRLGARPSSSLRRLAPSSNLARVQTRLLQTEAEAASGPGATICTTRFRPPLRSPPPSPGREHRRSVTEISLQTLRLSSSSSSPLSSSDKSPASARHAYRPFSTTTSLHCSHRRSEELDSSDTQDPSQPDEKESLGAMPSGRKNAASPLLLLLINVHPSLNALLCCHYAPPTQTLSHHGPPNPYSQRPDVPLPPSCMLNVSVHVEGDF
jgi:hypothetical protein